MTTMILVMMMMMVMESNDNDVRRYLGIKLTSARAGIIVATKREGGGTCNPAHTAQYNNLGHLKFIPLSISELTLES